MIRWLVAKYIENPQRHEPVNVGVLVQDGAGKLHPRFLQGQAAATIVGKSFDNYRAWVSCWTRKCRAGVSWDDLAAEARPKGPATYYLEVGGRIVVAGRPESEFPDHIFSIVVARPKSARVKPHPIEEIFERAGTASAQPKESTVTSTAVSPMKSSMSAPPPAATRPAVVGVGGTGQLVGQLVRTWEVAAGRYASISLPADPSADDLAGFEEFYALLKQEIALVQKRKRLGLSTATTEPGS